MRKKRLSPFHHVIRENEGGDILNKKDGHSRKILLEGNIDLLILILQILTSRSGEMVIL